MVYKSNNEEAISEVISVILLVAVTVILAAIIAAFAFGLVGNLQKGKVAMSTISRVNGSFVSVTFVGGQNAGSVVAINWTVNGVAPVTYIGGTLATSGLQDRPASGGILNVGANALLAASNSGKDRVIGVAVFSDGSKLVILDKTI
jgi:flagellin-like protein